MRNRTSAVSLLLALCVTVSAAVPARAALDAGAVISDGVEPSYDEAYYATTDYYGNLTDGSVVKSYLLNGAQALTDYGAYDQVTNLTDGSTPDGSGGRVTFHFGPDAPTHFYFEGKTARPFRNLPWTLTVRYSLNGVPSRAEDLAGKTGLVEISVDAVPNAGASEYAKNNYVLAATTVFNQDDILSLEAPGAQLQLIGNLRAVLFMAFPGEEAHFEIRVGSEEFSFSGLTFMMVPATLSQLEEIAKISEKKDDLEDSYHDLSDSLDSVLDAFSDMQSSLYETADGLDALDKARETIANRKGGVYGDLDVLRKDLAELETALNPLAGNAKDMSDFVTGTIGAVNVLMDGTLELQGDLKGLEEVLGQLGSGLETMEGGLEKVEAALGDTEDALTDTEQSLRETEASLQGAEDGIRDASAALEPVEDDLSAVENGVAETERRLADVEEGLEDLEDGLEELEDGAGDVKSALSYLGTMRSDLNRLASALTGVPTVKVNSSLDFRDTLEKVEQFDAAYTAEDFPTFLGEMLYLSGQAASEEAGAAMAAQLAPLAAIEALPEDNENYAAWVSVRQMAGLYQMIQAGMSFEQFVAAVLSQQPAYAGKESELAEQMAYLNRVRKSSHAPALDILLDSMETVMDDVDGVTNSANSAIQGLAAPTASVVRDLSTLCGRLDALTGMVDDVKDLSENLRDTSEALRGASKALRETLSGLRDTSADLRAASAVLRDTLNDAADASEALRGTLTAAADTVTALNASLDALTETSASLRGVSATARDGLDRLRSTSGTVRSVLDDADALRQVLNVYEPKIKAALTTLENLSRTASGAVRDSNRLIASAESLAKTAGEELNAGTEQTLDGLSSTLRRAAEGLDTTSQVQNAKNTITDLIEDTWDEYTGDVNNLLLMDAEADAESLTDTRNPSPQSVQVLIRTQEIELPDDDEPEQTSAASAASADTEAKPTTFLGRVGKMFRDMWKAVSGIFR